MSFDDVLYIPTGLSYQLSSASTHSLPSRIDQLSDSENDFDIEEDDSSSALGNSSFYIEFFSTKIANMCPRYDKMSRLKNITVLYMSSSVKVYIFWERHKI